MQIHTDLCPMVIFPHNTHSCTANIIIAISIKSELSGDNITQAGTTFLAKLLVILLGPTIATHQESNLSQLKMLYTNTTNSDNVSNAFVEAYNLTQSLSVQEPRGI